jgi:hypothetical protein
MCYRHSLQEALNDKSFGYVDHVSCIDIYILWEDLRITV